MTGVHDRQDEMPARTCNQLNLGSVTATTNHGEADRFRLFGGFTFCRCLNFFGRHQQFTILPQALKEPLSGCWEPVLLPVKAIEGGPIVSPCSWNGRWLAPAYCPQTKRATATGTRQMQRLEDWSSLEGPTELCSCARQDLVKNLVKLTLIASARIGQSLNNIQHQVGKMFPVLV